MSALTPVPRVPGQELRLDKLTAVMMGYTTVCSRASSLAYALLVRYMYLQRALRLLLSADFLSVLIME